MPQQPAAEQRPAVSYEVRAWAAVAVVLTAQLVGAVWWAATLSAEVRALRELIATQVTDHEQRLRDLERDRARRPMP